MDARACRPIILDPSRPDPARPRRPAPTSRSAAPARLPRHHPRPASRAVAAATRWSPSWPWPPPRSWPAPGRSTAIAEWAADAPQPVRAALGARRDRPRPLGWRPDRGHDPPDPRPRSTPRPWPPRSARGWPTATAPGPSSDRGGRSRSTARRCAAPPHATAAQVHLLAAMDHATRAVLAQRQVDGAPGEVPAFQPLLADLDLAGAVVTADALHTHPDAAEFLVGQQAGPLPVHRQGQPAHAAGPLRPPALAPGPRAGPHPRPRPRPRRAPHPQGRHRSRGFGFPHAAQVIQVTRKVRDLHAPGGGGP